MAQLRSETGGLQKFMGELQQTTKQWMADFEKQTNHSLAQIKSEMLAFDRLLWPGPFLDGAALSAARERIRTRANAGDKTAFALDARAWRIAALPDRSRRRSRPRMVETLDRLGTVAYRFWRERAGGFSVESTFELAQAWGAEINRLLKANNVPLSLRIIMPRATFDMGTMLSESIRHRKHFPRPRAACRGPS